MSVWNSQFKELVRHFFIEAKWYNQQYVPLIVEEHLSVSLITCGYEVISITSFLGMKDIVTKESFEWASKNPKIIEVALVVARLMDDIAGHEVLISIAEMKCNDLTSSI